MNRISIGKAVMVVGFALAAGSAALAQSTPQDLNDLVGARAAGGESALQSRGWTNTGTQSSTDRKYGYWWNAASNRCVSVMTFDGRYAAIVDTLSADCGHSTNRPAQGGYAGSQRGDVYAESGPINLICYGEGQKPAYHAQSEYHWDSEKHKYVYGTATVAGTDHFDTSVTFQFNGQEGRVRLPKKLIPPAHSDNDNGWWTLKDVQITPDRITAHFSLNGLNKPKIDIDRRTGHIKYDGLTDFSGTCERVDQGQHRF